MTNEDAREVLGDVRAYLASRASLENEMLAGHTFTDICNAIKELEQQPIDKSAMMYEIYMEGVNMTGEYQGCWVRFKNIEKIVNKYMAESEGET